MPSVNDWPEQEFFADGVADDVITALSRYPSLLVIARNSSFIYKARTVDVKQIGRELGVRYVLEGSLRKASNHIRVTAQLVEADSSKYVWAERYDRALAEIFAVQDEITEAVTTAIAPAIAAAEQQRAMRKPPESLDAWGAYQRGLWHLSKVSAEEKALAEKFFQRAIAQGNANILVVNISTDQQITVTPDQTQPWSTANVYLLSGESCVDPSPVLNGEPIGEGGAWAGQPISLTNGASISIPACGAAFIKIQP